LQLALSKCFCDANSICSATSKGRVTSGRVEIQCHRERLRWISWDIHGILPSYCGWLRNAKKSSRGWLKPYKSWDRFQLVQDFATIHRITVISWD
jgi:hypothetical protein